ncbi:rod shape-determining protein, partial [Bacillus altitudinis]|uniref:rod shape-determining protein n=1 Tax=Bacillus altitudinis TaxID=293387 RepID=UPI002352B38F
MDIRGGAVLRGVGKTMSITGEEIGKGLGDRVERIVDAVKMRVEKRGGELGGDIMEGGIVLRGGGGLVGNVEKVISDETKMGVIIGEDP